MPVVRVFVMDKHDRVLLIQTRHKKSDGFYWIVPGGMIEKGELSSEAAIREVKEETGLDITIKKLVWVEEGRNDKGEVGYIHYFLAEKMNEEPKIGYDPELPSNEQKIMDVVYKSREEIKGLDKLYPEVLKHDYFWKVVKEESHNPYVNRPSKGFGVD
ncbi:NUDIX hydrolase [Paenibacillus mesophilus]|uniref:NUDIX domain-containing protein n=1 Tax=Paenibacillus mesophilus TaxID=2582849 RepID=UPI00110DCABF|nr:NUDIX hydrolase [Paenibacillus mesophilus]TMV50674.1 NUDIX hydrolase [Paenibacillus mesophilus]